jgi:hypothetical protein
MIRFALPFFLVGSLAYAAESANLACVSDDAVTNYSRSADVVKMTEQPVKVKKPSRHRGKSKSKSTGYSMLAVRLNLTANHLLEHTSPQDADSYYDDDSDAAQIEHHAIPGHLPTPTMAKDAGPWLNNNGFINLMDCPATAAKMMDPKNIPMGAVVVYAGGHSGSIEIKTPSGWWSDHPRTDAAFAAGQKVMGVYIKPVLTK